MAQNGSETKAEQGTKGRPGSPGRQDIGGLFLNALRKLGERQGSTLRDVKRLLAAEHRLDVAARDGDIKLFVSEAIKRGQLSREGGKYKETRRRRRSGKSKSKKRRRRSSRRKRKSSPRRSRRRRSRKSGSKKRRRRRRKTAAEDDM